VGGPQTKGAHADTVEAGAVSESTQSTLKKEADRKPYTFFTDERRIRFLTVLERTGNVMAAAKAARVNRSTAYDERERNKEFADAWKEAVEAAIEGMELEAHRRAVKGTLKPVFYKGDQCGKIREYSDTLLIFMLKAHKPEKYRDTVEHSGTLAVATLSVAEWKAQAEARRAKAAEVMATFEDDDIDAGEADA